MSVVEDADELRQELGIQEDDESSCTCGNEENNI